MRTLFDDLRFARRMFARRRRFAALLVATIAVGIGSATCIFSLVDVVIWKELPYRDADRLYWVARTDSAWRASPVLARKWDNLGHTYRDYRQWASTQRSFEETGAWFATSVAVATDEGAEQMNAARGTASLAPMLGVRPVLGRWFLPREDDRGGPRLAVLSYETWRTRYGADSAVVGRRLTIDARPFEVVGVLPPHFQIAGDTTRIELWTPAGIGAGDWEAGNFNFRVFGRLRSNVSPRSAVREAEALLLGAGPDRKEAGVRLERLQDETTRAVRTPLVILLAAASLLLVIACGNVASLLVGESAARVTEIATRLSLGATRTRIARQVVTEHLLLAAIGGAAGTILAAGGVRVLRSVAPSGIPRIDTAHLDWRGIAFAVTVTVVTALLFSLGPIATLLRGGPAVLLRAGSPRVTSHGPIERAGVFVQCALVVVLLAGASLLVRTHRELVAVDVGFRAAQLLSVQIRFSPPVSRYRDAASRRALLEGLAAQVAALPGVERAAAAYAVPFQSVSTTSIRVSQSPVVSETDEVAGTYVIVSPGFFETMGIPVRAGRLFGMVDDGPGTATIVSETFARRYWPNAGAIGQRIRVDDVWRRVVGVVADVRHATVDEEPRSTFYLPAAQTEQRLLGSLVLRTTGDPGAHVGAVRRVIAQHDPTLISRADRLSDRVNRTLVAERFRTLLVSVFAGTAVLLAAIGIVGVATNATRRRRRELAIRMAVGAPPGAAIRLVMSSALGVGATGALAGVLTALFATRALRPFVYGISIADPLTHVGVFVLVVCVAGAASWLPARRVARLDLARTLTAD